MKNAHKWGVNPNLNPDYPAVGEEHGKCPVEFELIPFKPEIK